MCTPQHYRIYCVSSNHTSSTTATNLLYVVWIDWQEEDLISLVRALAVYVCLHTGYVRVH
jgi:hypothetical protein